MYPSMSLSFISSYLYIYPYMHYSSIHHNIYLHLRRPFYSFIYLQMHPSIVLYISTHTSLYVLITIIIIYPFKINSIQLP